MFGTMGTGYLSTIIRPKHVLMGIYGLRAILIIIVVFIPMSVTTVMIFSVFFGVSCSYKCLDLVHLPYFTLVSLVIDCSTYNKICR